MSVITSVSGNNKRIDALESGAFAEIYASENATGQSIPNGSSYTKITQFDQNGLSSNCTPDQLNNKITITKAGRYKVTGSFSFFCDANGDRHIGAAFLNGVEQSNLEFRRKIANGADIGSTSFSGFIEVSTTSIDLDFRVRHDDVSPITVTFEYINLNVECIGEIE